MKIKDEFIHIAKLKTPLGQMIAGEVNGKICLLEFVKPGRTAKQIKAVEKFFGLKTRRESRPVLKKLQTQLGQYFKGRRKKFDLPLELAGTEFQKDAWKQLTRIPIGQTRSYKDQAKAVGRHKAHRAVANANGKNRISIIVPCHRVIAHSGKLGGYGGGLWRKKFLLDLEGVSL